MDLLYSLFSIIIWWSPLLALSYMIYTTDFFRVFYTRCSITYSSIKELKKLIATKHKNPGKILLYTFITFVKTCGTMIFKVCWINFLQYMNNTVSQEGKFYYITFVIKGKLYKIKLVPPRGPENILQIVDETYNDVTDEITPYLRAQMAMIHIFTPEDFKKENIQVLTADQDDPYNFSGKEKILIKREEEKLSSLSSPNLNNEIPQDMQNILNGVFGMLENFQKKSE
jgi:hypothetical protein